MKYCMSFFMGVLLLLGGMFSVSTDNRAEAAEPEWYWISSDNNYTKFFDPKRVTVIEGYNGTASLISAITKTTYSYGGAKETLDNYGITTIIPNNLASSLATVYVRPQTRELAYAEETFYDKNGKALWSKKYQPNYREMNSQQFDEDFYAYIVDQIFGMGEVNRRIASDRWLLMWQAALNTGGYVNCMADTTTMRADGENIIFWEWQEYKDTKGNVTEIRFLKKAINTIHATGKVVTYQHWDKNNGWVEYKDSDTDKMYHEIEKGSLAEKELEKLKEYEKTHSQWLHRYSLADLEE